MIGSYLERSDAGWLLFVSDGAYIDANSLESLRDSLNCHDPVKNSAINGHCSQKRDYFEIFAKNSGAILSRKVAALLNQTVYTWDIACETEIDGSETLSHVLDANGLYAVANDNPRFLGYPFQTKRDYTAMVTKNFEGIQKCPKEYSSNRVCHPAVISLKNVVVWGGFGIEMPKSEFVGNAKKMLADIPGNVHFIYNVYSAELCIKN
jgi:hypothetical protein